jgi:phospholipid/cholesterol/gamma-HCH transport system substrate-binding protein
MSTKKKKEHGNIKVGVMVFAALAALILALFIIGDKKHLFGDTFTLQARFRDVNGLTAGNHVRFAGIDIGTVDEIRIVSDTMVIVEMVLEDDTRKYIRKNAIASIGTEGMMGNKVVNIVSADQPSVVVSDGDFLHSLNPVNMEETTRTLNETNNNVRVITENLKSMTFKLDSSALWSVLADTTVANSLKNGVESFNQNMDNMKNSFLMRGFKKKEK